MKPGDDLAVVGLRPLPVCDVVTINVPLHPENEHLFNDALIAKMKWGVYLVNTARGKNCSEAAASSCSCAG